VADCRRTTQLHGLGSQKGFTLVEILIATVIMAIISTMTAISIQQSLKTKSKTEKDIDEYAEVRDALNIIQRDISLAFHWIDINEEMKKRMIKEAEAKGQPNPFQNSNPPNSAGRVIPAEKLTAFIGEKDSIYLTTLSHQRTMTNSKESRQAKVGYYISSVKSMKDGQPTKALMRRFSTVLDEDVTKGGEETMLLENIKEFQLRYRSAEDKDWISAWNSTISDERTGNKFPDAVEITLTVARGTRELKLVTMASIHMTNNDPFGFRAKEKQKNQQGAQPR
jgi:prepilin-type N-terminal cleavage/methylation domain-containing protein